MINVGLFRMKLNPRLVNRYNFVLTDKHLDGVTLIGLILFVMCPQFGRLLNKLPVNRVLDLTLNGNNNTLVHFGTYDNTHSFLARTSYCGLHIVFRLGEP